MTGWILLIIMRVTLIADPDKAYFNDEKRVYTELQECQDIGLELAQWLTQDGTEVEVQCIPVKLDEEI